MVLAIVVLAVQTATRGDARLARNRREIAELGAVADAALNLTVLRLRSPRRAEWPATDATPFAVRFDGRTIEVSVQDEAGRIDLNAASGELLHRLLVAHGMETQGAHVLVDKVLDWREPGIGKRLNGAKAEDYQAAGLPFGPRNGPFASLDELKLVMGMSRDLFDRIRPALTVHSGSPVLDPALAPRGVLLALPGMDEAKVDSLLQARMARGAGEDATPDPSSILQGSTLTGHAFTITAQMSGPDLLRVTRTAAIRLAYQPGGPAWVYRWN